MFDLCLCQLRAFQNPFSVLRTYQKTWHIFHFHLYNAIKHYRQPALGFLSDKKESQVSTYAVATHGRN